MSLQSANFESEPKRAQPVSCQDCGHRWTGFYLPQPIAVVAKQMQSLCCPKCGADSRRIAIYVENLASGGLKP